MPDDKVEIRDGSLRTNWTWTRLFESFWIALLDPGKLLLAAAAIIVMYVGLAILALIFFLAPPAWPANQDRGPSPVKIVEHSPRTLASFDFWRDQSPVLLEPVDKFLHPLFVLFDETSDILMRLHAVLSLLWIFLTWAVFGGALTRMVAVQFARKEKIGPIEALTFSLSKWLSYFLAPLFPLIVVFVIALVMLIVGAILLNLFLDFLVGILWFLTLIGGIVMVATLLGYAGWPLMYATISVEGTDTFDAVFRSYSYLFQRPWRYIFYCLVSLVYGAIVIFFVVFATSFMVYMAKWGVDMATPVLFTRTGEDTVSTLFVYAPRSYEWQKLLVGPNAEAIARDMNSYQRFSAWFTAFWLHLVFLLMLGFAYSYFWTSSTIIYFLLRKSVDGNDLDEVFLVQEEEPLPPGAPAGVAPGEPASAPATSLPMVEAPKTAVVTAPPAEAEPPSALPRASEPTASPAAGDGAEKPRAAE
jgi:hypothetical protein